VVEPLHSLLIGQLLDIQGQKIGYLGRK
jgi:hypothetical protein